MDRIPQDAAGFAVFYREHVEAVLRFVVRRVADPHLAADLTAEVFVAAIRFAPRHNPARGTPRAWLYGVAHNVVASEFRRRTRERRATARIAGRRLLDADDVARIEDRIDAESSARTLYTAMDRLPEGERAVLALVTLDGVGVHDAAAALGIRPGTARARLHRARAALREELLPERTAP